MIRKAVIPAAGRGRRMLEFSHGLPKELLSVGGKSMIQRAVEMHVRSGIERIAVVLSPDKQSIRDLLASKRFADPRFRELLDQVELVFFEQAEPLGVAHAVSLAREFIGKEPFALVMPDCLLVSETPFLSQLVQVYSKRPVDMIGFVWLEQSRSMQFGNVGLLRVEPVEPPLYRILELSDKGAGSVNFSEPIHPKGFAGGIYGPDYFDLIPAEPGRTGEIDDVPIHQDLIRSGRLYGVELVGIAFDLGNPEGYRAAERFFSTSRNSSNMNGSR
ncbi:MAG: NTP transferase domain-containing protein [Deltaproteobacteria bacterium]|nr:NTP transferase domain-containing protein [Deltaproteobacteria bacterium]